MRAGRIEQVGTPAAIYEHPATEFVARFVGAATFLDGEVVEASAGGCLVRTALGVLAVTTPAGGPAPRMRVRLVIRPEAVLRIPRLQCLSPCHRARDTISSGCARSSPRPLT